MRWLIGLVVIITSSLLGLFTSYATVNNILPGHIKTINPKPEADIVGIEDTEADGILNNPIYGKNHAQTVSASVNPGGIPVPIESVEPYTETEEKPYRLFLIMGTDVVYSAPGRKTHSLQGRTDAILLAKMSADRIDLISLPRDSRVKIPGFGYDKLNAANVYGGPKLVLETIEQWLGVHVEDYALINTFGIVQFVDLFGGIDYNVPKRMKYNDFSAHLYIDLYPGMQHMDGMKVHNFLRFRHDGMGDLNRVARQQEIIKVMIPQILKPWNLIKVPGAVKVISENMETNISTGKMLFLASKALRIPNIKENVSMHTLPGDGKMYHGGWYWFVDERGTNKILQELALIPSDGSIAANIPGTIIPKNNLSVAGNNPGAMNRTQ